MQKSVRKSGIMNIPDHIGYTEFKGALAENAILQSLVPQLDCLPYYWNSGNRAEVDFLLQISSEIIPIEVKVEGRISGKSLSVYTSKFNPALRIRYSTNNLKENQGLINIPNYLSDRTDKIIQQWNIRK